MRLAPALGLDPGLTDQAALIAAVRGRLERAERWLLVFDNAVQPGALDPYLPRTGGGHVLVTSRWQDWESTAAVLELETLPEAEAVALLLGDGADDPAERAAAAELAQELGRLPLALAQARAFMRARKLGVAGYRQQLAAARPKVLAWRPPNAGYPLAVAQAWQASLDHAGQDCPAAGELIAAPGVPRPGRRPARPARRQARGAAGGAARPVRPRRRHRGARPLLAGPRRARQPDRAPAGPGGDPRGLDEATSGAWAATAVALVDAALPPPTWDNVHRPAIEKLLPQALAAAEAAERFGVGSDGVGAILTVVGEYLMAGGATADAEPLLRRAVAIRELVLGPAHPDLATSLHKLANACDNMGRPAEAEPLYRRVVAIREQAFDPEHPLVAEALGCLGFFLLQAGRRAEAEPIIARSLASYERTIGPEHPDLALSLFHMAWLYQASGRAAEAEPLYRRAIAAAEQALGQEHPRVADFLSSLAGLYRVTGRHAEAEPLFQRAIAIRERNSDPEDPELAPSLNRLAGTLSSNWSPRRGRTVLPARAQPSVSGRSAPSTPASPCRSSNLGRLYHHTGRPAEAEPLFQRAVAICEQARGPEHPDLAPLLDKLAGGSMDTCRYAEAEPLLRRRSPSRSGPSAPSIPTSPPRSTTGILYR